MIQAIEKIWHLKVRKYSNFLKLKIEGHQIISIKLMFIIDNPCCFHTRY